MLDFKEEKIYNTIEKHGKIRYNELKKIIVDKKGIMSERPFREKLAEMVKNKMVSRSQLGKQRVIYSIEEDAMSQEIEINEGTLANLYAFEQYLDRFEKKVDKISTYQRAHLISQFYHLFYYVELHCKIAELNGILLSKPLLKKFSELKLKTVGLLEKLSEEEKRKTLNLMKKTNVDHSFQISNDLLTNIKSILK